LGAESPEKRPRSYHAGMPRPSFESALDAVATLRDPMRRRLFDYVAAQGEAVSRDQAAVAMGISRALAAFHLEKLVNAGLLGTEYRRLSGRSGRGAGRTSKLYRRSRQAVELSLPARRYEILARLMAESASGSGAEGSTLPEIAHDYGHALGRRARQRQDSEGSGALDCVEQVATTLGFEPYRDSSGSVRLRNCPFDPLSRTYTPVVCGVTEAMLNGLVEGVGGQRLKVTREMRTDQCCGIVGRVQPLRQERT
jgi:predicted ArsR family transcriptional regulator